LNELVLSSSSSNKPLASFVFFTFDVVVAAGEAPRVWNHSLRILRRVCKSTSSPGSFLERREAKERPWFRLVTCHPLVTCNKKSWRELQLKINIYRDVTFCSII
jgi:hypothetical protein